jgi:hypothetical protein
VPRDFIDTHNPDGTSHRVVLVELDDPSFVGTGHLVLLGDAERRCFHEGLESLMRRGETRAQDQRDYQDLVDWWRQRERGREGRRLSEGRIAALGGLLFVALQTAILLATLLHH